MMLQHGLMQRQFLLREHNNLIQNSSHHTHHAAHSQHDIYSAYAYHQQQRIGSGNIATAEVHRQSAHSNTAEVLDLSRHCDSVETTRKTPSPYQTSSSHASNTPTASPTSSQPTPAAAELTRSASAGIPSNLIYSTSLHPALYYTAQLKQEPVSTSTCSPPPLLATAVAPLTPQSLSPVATPLAVAAASSSLLQSFAAAASATVAAAPAVAAAAFSPTANKMHITPVSVSATSPSSSSSPLTSADVKSTRPFKAYPRDPVVIAASFAATDVLYDNPRVERYTEYRKRVLEQIQGSNGGMRTVTNPKMRRTNSRSSIRSAHDNSENEERTCAADESSDCESNAGNCEKTSTCITSTSSNKSNAHATATEADNNNTKSTGGQVKDAAYYERRRKNNAAAKKSRDRRRIKEDEIAIRAAYLERQNIELLCQIDALKAQLATFTSKVVG